MNYNNSDQEDNIVLTPERRMHLLLMSSHVELNTNIAARKYKSFVITYIVISYEHIQT